MGKKVVHVEFPAKDPERATRFWSGVAGWKIEDAGMAGIDYRMFQEGDQGGAIYPPPDGSDMQGPIVYYGSENIDADLAQVRELGGDAGDKEPIPNVGWFARCRDTEGNPFSLFQSDETVQPH